MLTGILAVSLAQVFHFSAEFGFRVTEIFTAQKMRFFIYDLFRSSACNFILKSDPGTGVFLLIMPIF